MLLCVCVREPVCVMTSLCACKIIVCVLVTYFVWQKLLLLSCLGGHVIGWKVKERWRWIQPLFSVSFHVCHAIKLCVKVSESAVMDSCWRPCAAILPMGWKCCVINNHHYTAEHSYNNKKLYSISRTIKSVYFRVNDAPFTSCTQTHLTCI